MSQVGLWMVLIAPFVGSFLSVVVTRFSDEGFDVSGRSRCPSCRRHLAAIDLIPILSWLVLRGRCRTCNEKISLIYPICEIGALSLAFWVVMVVDSGFVIASCLLGWMLLALSLIDIRTYRIPNLLTGLIIALGAVVVAIQLRDDLIFHIGGAALGFLLLFAVRHAYRSLRGRDGLGVADERLLAAGGMWVGLEGVVSVLLLGSISGLIAVGITMVGGRKVEGADKIPFGPFLAIGLWLTWLYGPVYFAG